MRLLKSEKSLGPSSALALRASLCSSGKLSLICKTDWEELPSWDIAGTDDRCETIFHFNFWFRQQMRVQSEKPRFLVRLEFQYLDWGGDTDIHICQNSCNCILLRRVKNNTVENASDEAVSCPLSLSPWPSSFPTALHTQANKMLLCISCAS